MTCEFRDTIMLYFDHTYPDILMVEAKQQMTQDHIDFLLREMPKDSTFINSFYPSLQISGLSKSDYFTHLTEYKIPNTASNIETNKIDGLPY